MVRGFLLSTIHYLPFTRFLLSPVTLHAFFFESHNGSESADHVPHGADTGLCLYALLPEICLGACHLCPGGRDRREELTRVLRRLRGKPHESDFIALRYFPSGELFLDIGANYGQSIASMRLMTRAACLKRMDTNVRRGQRPKRRKRCFQRVSHSGLLEPRGTSTVLKEPLVRDMTTWSVSP